MKVLHFIASGGFFGAEKTLIELTRAQIRSGLNVKIICLRIGQGSEALERALQDTDLHFVGIDFQKKLSLSQYLKISSLINIESPDVIHSHSYKSNIYLSIFHLNNKKYSFVSTLHGYLMPKFLSFLRIYYYLDKICLHYMNAVVLVSGSIKNDLPKSLLKNINISVINNGISIDNELELKKNNDKNSLENLIDIKLVCVGRLSPEKDFNLAIQLFSEISEIMPNASLRIIGDGPEEKKLKSLCEQKKLTEKVIFTGYLENAFKEIHRSDILLITSKTEGLPITLLEAMKYKTLVAYTDVGDIDKVLLGGALGLKLTKSLTENAEKICKLMNEKEKYQKIVDNAYKRFVETLSSEEMESQYREIYDSVVKK